MEINFIYLSILIILFLAIIGVGIWANRRVKGTEDYAVAGRQLGLFLSLGTFVATFISAVSIIGGVGYASNYGWSFLLFQGIGVQVGIIILVLLAKKVHDSNCKTIPEYLFHNYNSRLLQVFSAFTIIIAYTVTLVSQLYAVGILVRTIVGIPEYLAVLIVGIVFLSYSVMGGLTAIARTDTIQAIIIAIGLSLAVIFMLTKVPLHAFFAGPFNTPLQGNTATISQLIAWSMVWGLGVAVQPYYLQRMFSSKNRQVARLMFGYGAICLLFTYLAITIIGIGAFYLAPENIGDQAFPYLAKSVFPPVLGVVVMAALIGGILSTVDSILNIVGVYYVNDIHEVVSRNKLTDQKKLFASRIATLAFGVICIITTVVMTFKKISFIVLFAAYAWGIIGSTLFVPIVIAVLKKKKSPAAGAFSSIFGFVGAVAGKLFNTFKITSIHEIYWGIGLSIIGFFLGYLLSKKQAGPDQKMNNVHAAK
ncbi:sodium:solute symporter family protein [Peribacillus saganii]|uniref:Sodium:solute symporter family protein n=1 Tax=Peribacillus saganii TaxID=2303992 RepID=A0A372LQ19_9BACI|nr:sodium:solute symporter family protein [Peribacillus saganii]RFU70298.1 sodium:solute symporter family protein [Peribacillus saganii]